MLVVSDESSVMTTVQKTLAKAGIDVSVANSDEALKVATELKPNLILLDIGSSRREGLENCRALHADAGCWHSPVIFVAERGKVPASVRELDCGAVDYLTKPLETHELLARVNTHLRLQRALDSLAEIHASNIQVLASAKQSCMPRPQDLPEARFQVAMRQIHHAGGDVYDVIGQGAQQTDYIVADATGHDLASTYWTLALKTLVSEYSSLLFSPLDSLYLINRALLRILPDDIFFTTVYARLNRDSGQLLLLSAGHPPAVHVPKNKKEPASIIQQPGDVLGSFADATFGRVSLAVQPGDRIFLFSDGLIEGRGKPCGLPCLVKTLRSLRRKPLPEVVGEVLSRQLEGFVLQDDALLMGIEV